MTALIGPKMKKILSARQLAWRHAKITSLERWEIVYYAIVEFYNEHHYSPTIRELMEMTGVTSSSVMSYYLDRLEEIGKIKREGEKRTSRTIIITGAIWLSPTDAAAFAKFRRQENDKTDKRYNPLNR